MKKKPRTLWGHQQHQAETVKDKASRYPPDSWWAVKSREEFNANLAKRLPTLQAIGAGVERTMRPMGSEG